MRDAMNLIRRFLADEQGATAIEYGLIAAGISLADENAAPPHTIANFDQLARA